MWEYLYRHSGHLGNGISYNVYIDRSSRIGDRYKTRHVYADGGYEESEIDQFSINLLGTHARPVYYSNFSGRNLEQEIDQVKQSGIRLKYDWKPSPF